MDSAVCDFCVLHFKQPYVLFPRTSLPPVFVKECGDTDISVVRLDEVTEGATEAEVTGDEGQVIAEGEVFQPESEDEDDSEEEEEAATETKAEVQSRRKRQANSFSSATGDETWAAQRVRSILYDGRGRVVERARGASRARGTGYSEVRGRASVNGGRRRWRSGMRRRYYGGRRYYDDGVMYGGRGRRRGMMRRGRRGRRYGSRQRIVVRFRGVVRG